MDCVALATVCRRVQPFWRVRLGYSTGAYTMKSPPGRVALPWPLTWQTWVMSLGSTFPLFTQEILEILHQLLRVEVIVTPWAQRLFHRRVIVLF